MGILVQFPEGEEEFSSPQILTVALQPTQPLSPHPLSAPKARSMCSSSPHSATPSWQVQGQLPFATSRGRDRESDD